MVRIEISLVENFTFEPFTKLFPINSTVESY